MAVTRASFSIHWISSLLLVGFSGLLYRFRGYKSKLVNITFQDIFSKFKYQPEWMSKMVKNDNKKLFKFKETDAE